MIDRYGEIKENILKYAASDDEIKAVIAIGSSTRKEVVADEYSDLDLVIVSENPDKWYTGEYPALLGNVSIAFIEPTLGGGKEYRAIYDEDKDVDMIVLTPELFENALREGVMEWVMNRGYSILYDSVGYEDGIKQFVRPSKSNPEVSEEEFINMTNDFYFHNIWASKKLLRGELWSAKMCVDAYLKNHLLKMVELYCYCIEKKDVWHDGRFIDRWANDWIKADLEKCFAHYEKADVAAALKRTHELFSKLAAEVAGDKGYHFPEKARKCAADYLERI